MEKVIIDTNFALIPFQFKVDIFEEFGRIVVGRYKVFILKECYKELVRMKAKGAIELLKQKGVKVVDWDKAKETDEKLIQFAKLNKAYLATQDKELRKKALKEKVRIITLRQRSYLIAMGE
jgi:hypothetical protein